MSKISSRCIAGLSGIVALIFYGSSVLSDQIHFQTSFESVNDFDGFYIVPNTPDASARHDLDGEHVVTGDYSHRSWIVRPNRESSALVNRNHRAYPTIQFQNTEEGPRATPLCISIYVWADIDLATRPDPLEDQWLSLATFTDDTSTRWRRTVLVNVSHKGIVHLQHVPLQGEHDYIFQSEDEAFSYREWQHLRIELDFSPLGYAKVWLNGVLVSHAHIRGIENQLAQAHFGLYASPSLDAGEVRNDDLEIAAGHCGK